MPRDSPALEVLAALETPLVPKLVSIRFKEDLIAASSGALESHEAGGGLAYCCEANPANPCGAERGARAENEWCICDFVSMCS